MAARRPSRRQDFEIAIICALSCEYDAVCLVFDHFRDADGDTYGRAADDLNSYTTGCMGHYDVVLALLPYMGKTNAASAAASMRSSYTRLRLVFLVGVCGATPRDEHLLGDVIISKTVIQYDLGCLLPDRFVRKDTIEDYLGRPNKDVRNFLAFFETDRGLDWLEQRIAHFPSQLQAKVDQTKRRGKYAYPGLAMDKLFEPTYRHKHHLSPTCICRYCIGDRDPVCKDAYASPCANLGCDERYLVPKDRFQQRLLCDGGKAQPAAHIGAVASADTVMKSAVDWDRISRETGVVAFEMEGAGVWDEVPCIIVKGTCDYADCHKHKGWQDFAAATAALALKAILERYIRTDKAVDAHGDEAMAIIGRHAAIQP